MNWYYVQGGQSVGPVSQADFDALVQKGTIQSETLVWHEGMANWQPYSGVRPSGATGATPAPATATAAAPVATMQPTGVLTPEVVCAECNKIVPKDSAIQYGAVWVCAACKPTFVQKLREGAALPGAGALTYGGFWIRLGAKLLDGLIMGVVFVVPAMIFAVVGVGSGRFDPEAGLGFQLLLQALVTFLSLAYNTFFLGKFGATPGKMVCSIKVVAPDGGPISYGRALGRSLAEILSQLVCYIGYIIAAFDREKRTLHDHIANTRVVRK